MIVSAVVAMFSGPETLIFPATPDGEIIDWGDLNGSFRGELDHEQALNNAGYQVINESDQPTSTVPEGSHGSDWSGARVSDGGWTGRQI